MLTAYVIQLPKLQPEANSERRGDNGGTMTPEQLFVAALSGLVGIAGIVLTIRNWIYGGSVIRVEMHLCRRDAMGGLVTGTVDTWRQNASVAFVSTTGDAQVDLVKVTVRNLGRTSATIHDVGLRGGPAPIPLRQWTVRPNFFSKPGELTEPVRIEAHDVKIFYFLSVPLVRSARQEFGGHPLAFRAAVMTGTGKQRLSGCMNHRKWNVWTVRESGDRSITGEVLTTREQARLWVELTENVYEPSMLWVRQVTDEAAMLVDKGLDREEAYEKLTELIRIFPGKVDDYRWSGFCHGLLTHLIELRSDGGWGVSVKAAAALRNMGSPE